MPKASQKVLDDAALNVEDWLGNKVVSRFARQEAAAFISGNGVLKPRGILSYPTATTADATRAWGTLQHVITGHASSFIAPTTSASPADCLVDTVYSLKATYRIGARWFMNSLTAGTVRKFKDADGKFVWTDRISENQPPLLLGYPVEFAEDLPDVGAGNFPIMFGDLSAAYQVVDRLGIRVLRDPYTQKGWVLFYSTMRVGGAVVNSEALKLLKVAAS
jgi:HK97 family phage major capsid protein